MKLKTLLKTLDGVEFYLMNESKTWIGEGANDWLKEWEKIYTEEELLNMRVVSIRLLADALYITLK